MTALALAPGADAAGRKPRRPRRHAPEPAKSTLLHRLEAKMSRHEAMHWGIRLGLAITLIGLYRSWKRHEDDEDSYAETVSFGSPGAGAKSPARNHARPVFLAKGGATFDAGQELDDVIQRFGEEKPDLTLSGTPTLMLDHPPARAEAADAEPEVKLRGAAAGGADGPLRHAAAAMKGEVNAPLPLGIREHFEKVSGESLEWSAVVAVALRAHGKVAITNQRFLVAYRRRTFALLPPSWASGVRRSSTPLSAVTRAEEDSDRRACFLAVGAATCLWYPLGTMATVLCIGLFHFARRPVLAVSSSHGGGTRRIPLDLADRKEAARTLNRLKGPGLPGVKKSA